MGKMIVLFHLTALLREIIKNFKCDFTLSRMFDVPSTIWELYTHPTWTVQIFDKVFG